MDGQNLTQTKAARELLACLDLSCDAPDRFLGASPERGTRHVYGGQLLAQSLIAAGRTTEPSRRATSLHGTFLARGRIDQPIEYEVDRLRDGASFSHRQVRAKQMGRPIFVATATFAVPIENGGEIPEHATLLTPPEAQMDEAEHIARLPREALEPSQTFIDPRFFDDLFERRSNDWANPLHPGPLPSSAGWWIRFRQALPDDPLLHAAILTYISDLELFGTSARPLGIGALAPNALRASLDHSIWFHHPIRCDSYFRHQIEGAGMAEGRGLGLGRIFNEAGVKLATTAQEGLLRLLTEED